MNSGLNSGGVLSQNNYGNQLNEHKTNGRAHWPETIISMHVCPELLQSMDSKRNGDVTVGLMTEQTKVKPVHLGHSHLCGKEGGLRSLSAAASNAKQEECKSKQSYTIGMGKRQEKANTTKCTAQLNYHSKMICRK